MQLNHEYKVGIYLYTITVIMCHVIRSHDRNHNCRVQSRTMAKMLRSMHMCTTLLLVGLTTCLLLRASLAAQCMPDPTNPCVARCNGSTFDVSKVFNYP